MIACNSCGSAISEDEKFCGQCGAPRPPAVATPPPPPIQSQEPIETFGETQIDSGPPPSYQESPPASLPEAVDPPAKKRPTCLWLTLGCGGLMLIIICLGVAGALWFWPDLIDSSNSVPLDTFFDEPFVDDLLSSIESTQVMGEPILEPDSTPAIGSDLIPKPVVEFEGISFSYDPSLAFWVTTETIPSDTSAELWAYPTHREFWFEDFIFQDSYQPPIIKIFPVSEYEAVNPTARAIIADQRSFIAEKSFDPQTDIPFLPVWNAAQVVHAYVSYLEFQNGSGVRFLTQFAQDTVVINNEELLYTFQGLTDDGQYYVAATFPISHSSLPPDGSIYPNTWDYWDFTDNYMDYILDVENHLDDEPPYNFYPDILLLDEMIESLIVEP